MDRGGGDMGQRGDTRGHESNAAQYHGSAASRHVERWCLMSTTLRSGTHWMLNPCCELHWASWEGEKVVYNAASGDTHLLDPVTALLLGRLQVTSATTVELANFVAAEFETEFCDEVMARVHRCLVSLLNLSLVDSRSA